MAILVRLDNVRCTNDYQTIAMLLLPLNPHPSHLKKNYRPELYITLSTPKSGWYQSALFHGPFRTVVMPRVIVPSVPVASQGSSK